MVYRETNVRRALNSVNSQVKTNDVMVKLGQSLNNLNFMKN